MEIILIGVIIGLSILKIAMIAIVLNFSKKIAEVTIMLDKSVLFTNSKLDYIDGRIDRLSTDFKDVHSTKPIKPNNWDSVKEAFKIQKKVEINERN